MSIIFGIHPVDELSIKTGFYDTDNIYVAHKKTNIRVQKILRRTKGNKAHIHYVSFSKITQMAQTQKHQGILLKRIENYRINMIREEKVLSSLEWGIYILIDRMNDPRNLGAIIRSMHVFEAKALILPKKNVPALGQTVWKVSCGALSHVPVLHVGGLPSFLNKCHKIDQIRILGADIRGKPFELKDIIEIKKEKRKIFLILGSEEKGISKAVLPYLHSTIKIPQSEQSNSLNVSVAAGIMLYLFSQV